jgi:hypothetical protein
LIERIDDLAEQMEPICNLDCAGCTEGYSVTNPQAPVAGDDLGAWMLAEPGCQGGNLVIS